MKYVSFGDKKFCWRKMSLTAEDLLEDVRELIRDAPPSHYSVKVGSFSLLSKNEVEKYESCVFEVGGYKWKLVLYPKGDKTRGVDDHISLYLVIADTSSLPPGWEVNVTYRFFVFDQIRDRYLTLGDVGGKVRRYHGIRNKCGFSKLMQLETFTDPSKGYLVDDTCEFGVEVFIVGNTAETECLEMISSPSTCKHSWKIEKFSMLNEDSYYSEVFTSGDHKWKIQLYPKGNNKGKKTSLSVYVCLADGKAMKVDTDIFARMKIQLQNQLNGNHLTSESYYWFKSTNYGKCWPKFISLNDLNNHKKGFLVNDTCILDAEVTVLGWREKRT